MELSQRHTEMSVHGFTAARGRVEAAIDRFPRYHLVGPDNERLAAHPSKHSDH